MSYALNNLKAILASKAVSTIEGVGYVVATSAGKATVASAQGIENVNVSGIVNVGDQVFTTGGNAYRSAPPDVIVQV